MSTSKNGTLDLDPVFDAIRRGGMVLLVPDASEGGAICHLVLAAERASPRSVGAMLSLGNGSTVVALTRDRCERFGLATVDGTAGLVGSRPGAPMEAKELGPLSAQRLARVAAQLANGDGAGSQARLDGVEVRCADWGGVVRTPLPLEAAVDLVRLAGQPPVALVSRVRSEEAAGYDCADLPRLAISQLAAYRRARAPVLLRRHGPRVRLPTRHGAFSLQAYEDPLTGSLHLALTMGTPRGPALVRVHSECLTGDLLGSLRCDCGSQFEESLAAIGREGSGVLIYLRQEGRGIGLVNKLRAYDIQDQGYDTVEANERLGFRPDLRDYSFAVFMLKDMGIEAVRLLTNNPRKRHGLERHGIQVKARVPLVVEPTPESLGYLRAKRDKLGHLLP
ncbi:MAG: GTP cyclohydrolase II [Thermoanaerobaculia bacterium]|nr:GTP cyclohydrolase II [Thermoanaerobaculia bacterium]